MENNIRKCSVIGCESKVHEAGLCTKHYNQYCRCGDVIGVYKITLKEKIYVGMSCDSIKSRINNEKSSLIRNSTTNVSKELLNYFNEICSEEQDMSRKDLLNKYFKYEIVESSVGWHKVDENFNEVPFNDKTEQKKLIFNIRISENEEVQKGNRLTDNYWKLKESQYIRIFKELDKINRTNNCLNILN